MSTAPAGSIDFVVPGSSRVQEPDAVSRGAAPPALPQGFTRGSVKQSVRVGAQRGGGSDETYAIISLDRFNSVDDIMSIPISTPYHPAA